jgi:chorismate mutase
MLKLCLADAIQHQKLISGEQANLSSYRESLDKLDEDLILLLHRRKKLVEQVKAFKKEHQLSPRDEDREREIIARSRDLGRELDLDDDIVYRIMHLVLQSSQ